MHNDYLEFYIKLVHTYQYYNNVTQCDTFYIIYIYNMCVYIYIYTVYVKMLYTILKYHSFYVLYIYI